MCVYIKSNLTSNCSRLKSVVQHRETLNASPQTLSQSFTAATVTGTRTSIARTLIFLDDYAPLLCSFGGLLCLTDGVGLTPKTAKDISGKTSRNPASTAMRVEQSGNGDKSTNAVSEMEMKY